MKATITPVKIGNLEIEGLMLDDNSFAVAVTQIVNLFPFFQSTQNYGAQTLKRLMGAGFNTNKTATEISKSLVSYVTLDQFVDVIKALTRKGDEKAFELADNLIGLSLTQLFSDAFGVKFEADNRQLYLKNRQAGKVTRRKMTDAIKLYIDFGDVSDTYAKFVYSNCSEAVNKSVLGGSAKVVCVERNVERAKLRDALTPDELHTIEAIENLAMKLIDNKEYEPLSAVKMAIDLLT